MKLPLTEDRLPKQLNVIFSSDIVNKMDNIENYNQNNIEEIKQWYDYIEGIKRWLSNPSIAWDYANRFAKFPNGTRFIRDFDYNIGYTIKTNQYGTYVYIFMINLKPQEFGLKIPPTLKENKIRYRNITMKTNKKVIRLTESDLHLMIEEAVKTTLNELDWKTYASVAEKASQYNAPKPKGRDYRHFNDPRAERGKRFTKAAADAFQRDYGNTKSYTYSLGDDGRFGYTQKINPDNSRAIEYHSESNPTLYGVRDVNNLGHDMYDDTKLERRPQEYEKIGVGHKNKEYDDFEAFDKMDNEYKSMDLDTMPQYRKTTRKYIKGKGWQ